MGWIQDFYLLFLGGKIVVVSQESTGTHCFTNIPGCILFVYSYSNCHTYFTFPLNALYLPPFFVALCCVLSQSKTGFLFRKLCPTPCPKKSMCMYDVMCCNDETHVFMLSAHCCWRSSWWVGVISFPWKWEGSCGRPWWQQQQRMRRRQLVLEQGRKTQTPSRTWGTSPRSCFTLARKKHSEVWG